MNVNDMTLDNLTSPTLYILMRQDIPDMNPGKAMAQAAHAQAAFDQWVDTCEDITQDVWEEISEWRGANPSEPGTGRHFGRTIVLQANYDNVVYWAQHYKLSNGLLHKVVDSTYPYRNWYGQTFTMNTITCWWTFLHQHQQTGEQLDFIQKFDLYP